MDKTIATGLSSLPKPAPKLASNVLDLFSLKGKFASITGGGAGIGFAVAEAYAQAGADVAIWYNSNEEAIKKAANLEKQYGVKARAYKCRITEEEEVKKTIDQQIEDFGRGFDIVVGNAGLAWVNKPLIDEPDSRKALNIIDVNVNGLYFLAKYVGPVFKKQGHGSLIMTASMSGHIANVPQYQTMYNASKAAVLHMGKSLAMEWSGFARVNTVSPGYIDTEITKVVDPELKKSWYHLTPMGRLANPRELVGAYLYFASDASTFTTGSDLIVDGGYCAM